ncbi:hypothetical protein BA953_17200 [Vibrio coralliilyticus]|uniref:hypothetical protein n=1 Tax=Vibrio coralliilyticus TaxID=190893 RepID=UPI000810B700|nr:hypothetical protein [Vibrio coralliilyticus]ANW25926.1 hypothetical protein BA953_17200 [Vibrio coralliilyticus]
MNTQVTESYQLNALKAVLGMVNSHTSAKAYWDATGVIDEAQKLLEQGGTEIEYKHAAIRAGELICSTFSCMDQTPHIFEEPLLHEYSKGGEVIPNSKYTETTEQDVVDVGLNFSQVVNRLARFHVQEDRCITQILPIQNLLSAVNTIESIGGYVSNAEIAMYAEMSERIMIMCYENAS